MVADKVKGTTHNRSQTKVVIRSKSSCVSPTSKRSRTEDGKPQACLDPCDDDGKGTIATLVFCHCGMKIRNRGAEREKD